MKTLLGPQVSPASHESARASLAVVAMARVAAVGVIKPLPGRRVAGDRTGRRRDVRDRRSSPAAAAPPAATRPLAARCRRRRT